LNARFGTRRGRFLHYSVLTKPRRNSLSFRVQGLDPDQSGHLNGLSVQELTVLGATRYIVDAKPGFPDRIEVRDLEIGEKVILLNFEHQPTATPYRSRHAIFVREGAEQALDVIDELPEVIRIRPISLRAFSTVGEMVYADLAEAEISC
jgi:hypothetical protein